MGHTLIALVTAFTSAVHPHIRWAYKEGRTISETVVGSSPHTWGIPDIQPKQRSNVRFIPTYVGHTCAGSASTLRAAVHPHIRGAYAVAHQHYKLAAVHPHIRGAYVNQHLAACGQNGSSPHTWGIRGRIPHSGASGRFIPTYVGHTAFRAGGRWEICGSSPHTWGIRMRPAAPVPGPAGSSPHTWGIRRHNMKKKYRYYRFIPTYVGHTHRTANGADQPPVHPHIRGAYCVSSVIVMFTRGSSPHTWGILISVHFRPPVSRFIPTYVGHTLDRRKKNGWFQPLFL